MPKHSTNIIVRIMPGTSGRQPLLYRTHATITLRIRKVCIIIIITDTTHISRLLVKLLWIITKTTRSHN